MVVLFNSWSPRIARSHVWRITLKGINSSNYGLKIHMRAFASVSAQRYKKKTSGNVKSSVRKIMKWTTAERHEQRGLRTKSAAMANFDCYSLTLFRNVTRPSGRRREHIAVRGRPTRHRVRYELPDPAWGGNSYAQYYAIFLEVFLWLWKEQF